MGVPSFQQLMLPALQTIGRRYDEISISGLEDEVSKALKISLEERQLRLPSGNQTLFANRLNWARSYLSKARLIELPRRGYCRATDRGRELLAEGVSEINFGLLERYPEFVAWRSQTKGGEATEETESRDDAEESIASSFELLNAELARNIVGRVHSFSPAFFERLIIDLLVRMGYGGGRVEMGRALGRVGDGGVDGVIKEDELGLDVVYVQAKRLDPNKAVPLSEVRDFVGGLEGHRASKGVMVTTSYFPSTAYDFITRVSKRVVLIDGQALANLMIRHRVGVRVKDVYEVRKIDDNYFAEWCAGAAMRLAGAEARHPAISVRAVRLGFLGLWPFRYQQLRFWALDFLGFPWILSCESRLINGLRGIKAQKFFAALLPWRSRRPTGIPIVLACGGAELFMGKSYPSF